MFNGVFISVEARGFVQL